MELRKNCLTSVPEEVRILDSSTIIIASADLVTLRPTGASLELLEGKVSLYSILSELVARANRASLSGSSRSQGTQREVGIDCSHVSTCRLIKFCVGKGLDFIYKSWNVSHGIQANPKSTINFSTSLESSFPVKILWTPRNTTSS